MGSSFAYVFGVSSCSVGLRARVMLINIRLLCRTRPVIDWEPLNRNKPASTDETGEREAVRNSRCNPVAQGERPRVRWLFAVNLRRERAGGECACPRACKFCKQADAKCFSDSHIERFTVLCHAEEIGWGACRHDVICSSADRCLSSVPTASYPSGWNLGDSRA